MSDNALITLMAVGVFGAVLIYAVRRGRGITLQRRGKGVKLVLEESKESSVVVGKGMKLEGSSVGDIAGFKGSDGAPRIEGHFDVAENMDIRSSTIGDVVGVKLASAAARGQQKAKRER